MKIQSDCPICWVDFEDNESIALTRCHHSTHISCFSKWSETCLGLRSACGVNCICRCCICRRPLTLEDVFSFQYRPNFEIGECSSGRGNNPNPNEEDNVVVDMEIDEVVGYADVEMETELIEVGESGSVVPENASPDLAPTTDLVASDFNPVAPTVYHNPQLMGPERSPENVAPRLLVLMDPEEIAEIGRAIRDGREGFWPYPSEQLRVAPPGRRVHHRFSPRAPTVVSHLQPLLTILDRETLNDMARAMNPAYTNRPRHRGVGINAGVGSNAVKIKKEEAPRGRETSRFSPVTRTARNEYEAPQTPRMDRRNAEEKPFLLCLKLVHKLIVFFVLAAILLEVIAVIHGRLPDGNTYLNYCPPGLKLKNQATPNVVDKTPPDKTYITQNKRLSLSSNKCVNLLKSETVKFQEVYEKYSKEDSGHLQALKVIIAKREEQKELLLVRYEQLTVPKCSQLPKKLPNYAPIIHVFELKAEGPHEKLMNIERTHNVIVKITLLEQVKIITKDKSSAVDVFSLNTIKSASSTGGLEAFKFGDVKLIEVWIFPTFIETSQEKAQ